MPLNDRQIKNARPAEKDYKMFDGGGLFLPVKPNGGKYWRLKYRMDGKERSLSIGKYPLISLAEARAAREQAKQMMAQGQDPAAAKQQAKKKRAADMANTFQAVAEQWHKRQLPRWKPNHAARVWRSLELDVFPYIGSLPVSDIKVSDVKAVIERIAERGTAVTADKIRQRIDTVVVS